MPTQKESPATGVSTYITPRFHRRGTPACPDRSRHDTKNAKRTQFTQANSQSPNAKRYYTKRTQSIPMVTLPHAKKSKRTQFQPAQQPIANSQKLFLRNEPNFHPGGPVEDQKYETNPISPRPTTRLHQTNPISARRIYETNPIPVETPNLRTTNHQLRTIMRNERNSRIPSVPPPPISAKRTQFTPPSTIHNIQYTIPGPISPPMRTKCKWRVLLQHLEKINVIVGPETGTLKEGFVSSFRGLYLRIALPGPIRNDWIYSYHEEGASRRPYCPRH